MVDVSISKKGLIAAILSRTLDFYSNLKLFSNLHKDSNEIKWICQMNGKRLVLKPRNYIIIVVQVSHFFFSSSNHYLCYQEQQHTLMERTRIPGKSENEIRQPFLIASEKSEYGPTIGVNVSVFCFLPAQVAARIITRSPVLPDPYLILFPIAVITRLVKSM
jgi:hypothetical protein